MKDRLYILLNAMVNLGEIVILLFSAMFAIFGDMEMAIYMMLVLLFLKK